MGAERGRPATRARSRPPTARLETDAALAFVVFCATLYHGVRTLGPLGHLETFAEPSIVMLPLNLVEQATRTFSLILRLFGNVTSGVFVVGVELTLADLLVPIPLMALDVPTGAVQAHIFATSATVFVGSAVDGHASRQLEKSDARGSRDMDDIRSVGIIAAAIAGSFGAIGPALGEGRAVAAAMDAIARQPEAAGVLSRWRRSRRMGRPLRVGGANSATSSWPFSSAQGFVGAFYERILEAAKRLAANADGERALLVIVGERGAALAEEMALKTSWAALMAPHIDEAPLLPIGSPEKSIAASPKTAWRASPSCTESALAHGLAQMKKPARSSSQRRRPRHATVAKPGHSAVVSGALAPWRDSRRRNSSREARGPRRRRTASLPACVATSAVWLTHAVQMGNVG